MVKDLEGYASLKDWLVAQIDLALLVALPERDNRRARIVFELPIVGTKYSVLNNQERLEWFKKKVNRCGAGLGPVATRRAKKLAGIL
jgi:hypothetical protein